MALSRREGHLAAHRAAARERDSAVREAEQWFAGAGLRRRCVGGRPGGRRMRAGAGMVPLVEAYQGELIPSRAFAEGGIHEAILAYEDTMFFEILAQELALRDMDSDAPTPENYDELRERMDVYLGEFEQHGTDNITVEM